MCSPLSACPLSTGSCYPCPETVEVSCTCGSARLVVPCGRERSTKPPRCKESCRYTPGSQLSQPLPQLSSTYLAHSHHCPPPVLLPPTTVLHLPKPPTTDPTRVPSVSQLGVPPPAITPSERATGATLGPALPAGSCAYCSCPTVATPAPSPAMTWSWSAPNRWLSAS